MEGKVFLGPLHLVPEAQVVLPESMASYKQVDSISCGQEQDDFDKPIND